MLVFACNSEAISCSQGLLCT